MKNHGPSGEACMWVRCTARYRACFSAGSMLKSCSVVGAMASRVISSG